MTARVLAVLLTLLAPAAAAAEPGGGDFDAESYWYVDIERPFFVPDGKLMVPRRPGGRARPFLRDKPAGALRVFVLGGSVAAQYDSEPALAYGWTLEKVLGRAAPGRRVEVIHCGMPAYDSYREALILREILAYAPDVVVLMSGNNENSEQSGPPPRWAAATVRLRMLLRAVGLELPAPAGTPARRGAPRNFTAPFEANVRSMTRRVREAGAVMVLCTLPRQLGLPPDDALPLSAPGFAKAWALLEKGDLAAAQRAFSAYSVAYPCEAFGHLWLGRLLERRGRADAARREYLRALEVRYHVPRLNRILRAIAAQEGAAVADLEESFPKASAGARDQDLLNDEMHWNRFADPRVSVAVARALAAGDFAARLGVTDRRWLEREGGRLARLRASARELDAIYYKKLGRAFWATARMDGALGEGSIAALESLQEDYPQRLSRLARRKADVSDELARRIAGSAWLAGGRADWRSCWAPGLAHLGEAYRRRGRLREALACFSQALREEPGQDAARVHQAMTLAALGRRAEALRLLAGVKDRDARFPELCWSLDRCAPAPGTRPAGVLRAELLAPALARLGRGEWERGFREMSRATGGFSRQALGALDEQCGAGVRDCAPWRRAQEFLRGLNDEGMRAVAAGDGARAARVFDAVLRLYPSQPSALINRAVVAAGRGDLDAAVALYGRALEADLSAPGLSSDILSGRATVLEKLGRRAEAAADLETALKAAPPGWPRSSQARESLARLKRGA